MSADEKKALQGAAMLIGFAGVGLFLLSVAAYLGSVWSSGTLSTSLNETAIALVVVSGIFGIGAVLLYRSGGTH